MLKLFSDGTQDIDIESEKRKLRKMEKYCEKISNMTTGAESAAYNDTFDDMIENLKSMLIGKKANGGIPSVSMPALVSSSTYGIDPYTGQQRELATRLTPTAVQQPLLPGFGGLSLGGLGGVAGLGGLTVNGGVQSPLLPGVGVSLPADGMSKVSVTRQGPMLEKAGNSVGSFTPYVVKPATTTLTLTPTSPQQQQTVTQVNDQASDNDGLAALVRAVQNIAVNTATRVMNRTAS